MCIIAYCKKGVKLSDDTIKIMFKGNPDGAGIMWKPSDKADVEIRKGFMTVDELLKAWHKIPVSYERALHCRIATAGKISKECCHPFPVRDMADNMMKSVDRCDVVLMHNGVISYTQPKDGIKSPYSDTMLFAKYVLYPMKNQLDEVAVQLLIENSTPSRLLIMRKGKPTLTFGSWQKDENGVMYSNGNYKPSVSTYGKYGSYYSSAYNYGYGTYYSTKKDDCGSKALSTSINMDEQELEDEIRDYNASFGYRSAYEDYDSVFTLDMSGVLEGTESVQEKETLLDELITEIEDAAPMHKDDYLLVVSSEWTTPTQVTLDVEGDIMQLVDNDATLFGLPINVLQLPNWTAVSV